MPVVVKIEGQGFQVDVYNRLLPDETGRDNTVQVWNDDHVTKVCETYSLSKIEAVYSGVVKFVEWWNDLKNYMKKTIIFDDKK
jgi:hypothetical protein